LCSHLGYLIGSSGDAIFTHVEHFFGGGGGFILFKYIT
jgi:hypothetical protein